MSYDGAYYVALGSMPANTVPSTSPAYWWECSPVGITLASNYAGVTQTGATYSISQDFTASLSLPLLNPGDINTGALVNRAMRILDALSNPTLTTMGAGASIDLAFTDRLQLLTKAITADTTFNAATTMSPGRKITLRLTNASGSARNFTFPSDWVVVPAKPASIANGKTALLTLTCFGTTNASVVGDYRVQS